MKKSLWVVVLVAVFGIALPVKAQDEAPKLELYAGYDYARFNVTPTLPVFRPLNRSTRTAVAASSNTTTIPGSELWEI